jgi:hypothetical protein
MKKSILWLSLALCLCLPSTRSFGEMVQPPSSDGPSNPISFELEGDNTYIGNADVARGIRRVNDFHEWNFAARFLIMPMTPVGILRLGGEYELYDFSIAKGGQLPSRMQSIAAVVGLDTKLSDEILIRFEAKPGYYSTDTFDSEDFDIPFLLGGTYLYSSTLQFVLGVGVDYESKYPVLPGGGIRWKFAPQWVLNAVLPQPRLEYELNSNLLLYAGGEFRAKNARTDNEVIGDASEPGNLRGTIVSYLELRTGAGVAWKINDNCKISAEAGYLPYREFEYHRTIIRYKSDGGAPYGTLALHCSF